MSLSGPPIDHRSSQTEHTSHKLIKELACDHRSSQAEGHSLNQSV